MLLVLVCSMRNTYDWLHHVIICMKCFPTKPRPVIGASHVARTGTLLHSFNEQPVQEQAIIASMIRIQKVKQNQVHISIDPDGMRYGKQAKITFGSDNSFYFSSSWSINI